MSGAKLTGEELQRVKQDVLREQESYLCGEIRDPGRYFAPLRSKGILSQGDCDVIRKQHTPDQMVGEFVRILITQRGRNDVSSFDVFVEALINQRVQAHIARSLMKTYAKRKAEREQQKGWSSSAVIVGFSRNPGLCTVAICVSLPQPRQSQGKLLYKRYHTSEFKR